MKIDFLKLEQYLPDISTLPVGRELTHNDLLTDKLRLYQEKELAIYYTPFDYVKPDAKLAIVGITPGWKQMELAYRVFRNGLAAHKSLTEICHDIEKSASFAGSMRTNLINMLDELKIPPALGVPSSAALFESQHHLIHTTSIIRYPVFIQGENYTGHKPHLLRHPKLREFVETLFIEEIEQVQTALVIPLGKAVSEVLEYLIDQGKLSRERCLLNFPHPSGANGHRRRHFAMLKDSLKAQVSKWFYTQ